jgi:hypothetical protein
MKKKKKYIKAEKFLIKYLFMDRDISSLELEGITLPFNMVKMLMTVYHKNESKKKK